MTSWLTNRDSIRSSIQLASNGRWEDALLIEQTGTEALLTWLEGAGANVAIESVYGDEHGNFSGFFGFRRQIENANLRKTFWQVVIAHSQKLNAQTPADQLAAWLSLLGVPALTTSEPDGVQLGVFNQWLSAVPVDLKGERLTASDLNNGPDWLRGGATAPICKECFWLSPERVWIAELASVENAGTHVLEPHLLPN